MNEISKIFTNIKDFLNIYIVTIGGNQLTLWTIIYFIFLSFVLVYFTKKLKNWIVYNLLEKSKIDIGVRLAVGTIFRYLILVLGFIIVLQTVGIDLSTLTILASALGVGIGFGLQNITNNFVSGIIILFERPIKVGDSSLNFSLRVWTQKHITTPQVLKSKLYFQIFKVFKENGIEIPFPQRDVHIIEKKEIFKQTQ